MEWEPQNPSAPPSSSSLSSQSVNSIGTRSEKVPVLKQIPPSPAVTALSKLTDDELRRKGVEDLLRIIRRVEADYKSLLGEHGNVVKDVNRRLQIFVLETRSLKEVNQKLQDDNQELRDLCCFLDDDRQRGRKLAREWQRFGRYTARVMRSEVAVYQEKLRELEDKQNDLITENMELKELCIFLDQERVRMTGDRDEGDGSSNGTVTGHEDGIVSMETVGLSVPNTSVTNNYPISPSSTASYIRELELKVRLLEDEKKMMAQRMDRNNADGFDINSSIFGSAPASHMPTTENDQSLHGLKPGTTLLRKSPVSSKPETVMHAMKVLQVHEELEKTPTEDDGLDDPEKAIVREMCNVVWRTLGDTEEIGSFNESSDSIHEPPYITDSANKSNVPPSTQPPHGQTYGYNSVQPQSQTTGIAIPAAMKQSNVGYQTVPGTTDNFSGTISHQLQSQRHISSRPSHESKQQQSSQSDPEMRGRQNSLSEKISVDRGRNFPQKQPIDRLDDRRNPEQKHFSHFIQDTGKPSNLQQLSHQLPLQQPSSPSSHQLHGVPDMASDLYPSQRPTDLTARSNHQSSQPLPISAHQQQQNLFDTNLHSHPSQRNTNLTSRSVDLPHRFQQRPSPPQHPSSAYSGNPGQRSMDSQSNKLQSGHNHPHYREFPNATNLVGHPSQNQQNTQSYPHQQVKLLDAPGTGRHVQRSVPTHVQVHATDRLHEESISHGQTRLQARGEMAYEERNSVERDTQSHPASRSVSSSSVLNPSNPQIYAQNQQGMKTTQNFKGPSVFRAYPPQLTSMPTQSVSLKGSQSQELSSNGTQNQHDPTRGNQPLGSQPQNKRFQEQEWRQTYLDDSDTL